MSAQDRTAAPVSERTVTFDETGEERVVKSRCLRCELSRQPWTGVGVVSASGVEHIGADYGMTACGVDATGDGWWWPL